MVSFPLMAVATEASRRGVPTLLVGGRMVSVGDPVMRGLPLLGCRFGSSVDAVASRVGFGRPGSPPPVVAADRYGEAVMLDPLLDEGFDATDEPSIVVDVARRALGVDTPPPTRSVAAYLDAVWLDRALDVTLDAPLGDPPDWQRVAALHPSAPATPALLSPEHLVHRRRCDSVSWPTFRSAVTRRQTRWPPITGALAAWFDDGSFSRHLFSLLPEPAAMRAELAELLRPSDVAWIESVVAA